MDLAAAAADGTSIRFGAPPSPQEQVVLVRWWAESSAPATPPTAGDQSMAQAEWIRQQQEHGRADLNRLPELPDLGERV
ncbi:MULTISPECIES: hypothetical protein [unclassified Crossiella]|uniref:hypothetical protein n=1 Tax=unclassified Crossiella TaxID=2620835 RepID=UPI0020002CDB|nr:MULTISPECIES: hypothetical protein [unclassified Crossiella]MCK2240094.1 hypothetical protein [Crossiella sp. S99.2]MCK2252803.1 hypothetical protein [Crossiella sp. S99.1]